MVKKDEKCKISDGNDGETCDILQRDINKIASRHNAIYSPFGDFMEDMEMLETEHYKFVKNPELYEKLKEKSIIGGFGNADVDLVIIDKQTEQPIGALGLRKYASEVYLVEHEPFGWRTRSYKKKIPEEYQEQVLLDYLHLGEDFRHEGHGGQILDDMQDMICACGFEKLLPTLPNRDMEALLRKKGFDYDEKRLMFSKSCPKRK